MQQKQRLWKQRPFIVIVCVCVLGLGVVGSLLYLGYQVAWTGFSVPTCPPNQQCPSNKTLWDWLQLLVIPLALTGAGFWFSQVQKKTEVGIAKDKQREDLLQAYLDRMTELLLREDLQTSKLDSKVRNVARVRTLTVLGQLDTPRINHVLSFLREAQLVSPEQGKSIVSFSQAEMRSIDLKGVKVYEIDFSDSNLHNANLSDADFSNSSLHNANLSEANLSGAFFNETDLSNANFGKADLSFTIFGNNNNLSGAYFGEANFSSASLIYADLSGVCLSRAVFSRTALMDANLSGADLSGVDLRRVDFSGANLSGANLSGVDLRGADFSGADFSGANLSEAVLSRAIVQKALNITEEQLKKARIL